jgi:hypothetical protein
MFFFQHLVQKLGRLVREVIENHVAALSSHIHPGDDKILSIRRTLNEGDFRRLRIYEPRKQFLGFRLLAAQLTRTLSRIAVYPGL